MVHHEVGYTMTSQARDRFRKRQELLRQRRIRQAAEFVVELEGLGATPSALSKAGSLYARAIYELLPERCHATAKSTGRRCRNKAEPDHWVCKFHGGLSTGPRTPEGRQRSLAALQEGNKRWRARTKGDCDCD